MANLRNTLLGAVCVGAMGLGAVPALALDAVTIGATVATSSHYTLAVALSKAIKSGMPDANVTVVETGASVDNLRRLSKGEVDIGLTSVDVGTQALNGLKTFEGRAIEDVVALFPYDMSVLNVVVREDSGITTLEGLDGEPFAAGDRGSAAEVVSRATFDVNGIEPDWYSGSITDAVEALKNRQIVGFAKYGPGTRLDSVLQEILTSTDLRLLSYNEEQQEKTMDAIPGIGFAEIPADRIPGMPAANLPVSLVIYATRSELMSDDEAYELVKSVYENRQDLIDAWPHLENFDFKERALQIEELGLPLHPGAKRFWETVE